jgi:hypothetical protein
VLAILAAVLGVLASDKPTERWEPPPGVSSPMFESHPAFDPRTGDFWFVRSDKTFRGWRMLVSRCGASGWAAPADAPIAGDGVEADPWFTRDGRTLWFISTRTTDGLTRRDLDIWKAERGRDGRWATPARLPAPVNSPGQEWYPRLSADGWLYFGSSRAGGLGRTDIWRARQVRGRWTVENLGPAVNTAGDEYEPLPSPDGRSLIVQADESYYLTRRRGRGWTPRVKLGQAINGNGSEIGAAISPSGRSLLFARNLGDPISGELMLVRAGHEAWPPSCTH